MSSYQPCLPKKQIQISVQAFSHESEDYFAALMLPFNISKPNPRTMKTDSYVFYGHLPAIPNCYTFGKASLFCTITY